MPTVLHQLIVQFIFRVLEDFVRARGLGHVFVAPLPVRLAEDKYREPDVVFVRPERISDLNGYPAGADLVVEVVSDGQDNRQRDLVEKRLEYAAADIREYWIVDPHEGTVTVLSLEGKAYRELGVFRENDQALSGLLAGFSLDVRELFARDIKPERRPS